MDRTGPSCTPGALCVLLWLLGLACTSQREHAVARPARASADEHAAGSGASGTGGDLVGDAASSVTGGASGRDPEQPAAQLADAGVPGPGAPDAAVEPADSAGWQGMAGAPTKSAHCGAPGDMSCANDQFCNYAPDSDCGTRERAAQCERRPAGCDTSRNDPVCGCDRRTYTSACTAHLAGISIAHSAMCTVAECEVAGGHVAAQSDTSAAVCREHELSWPIASAATSAVCCWSSARGPTCGGFAALPCASGEFCNYERTAGGQGCDGRIADAAGSCQMKPQGCSADASPVCGCDRHTYAATCAAHALGVSVLHPGTCDGSE